METVVRGAVIYMVLLVMLRVSGKRSLAQITTFDFVLLLIIGETAQQGLLGEDFSVTSAVLLIMTLVMLDVGLSLLKQRWPRFDKLIEGVPMVIVEDGKPLKDRMDNAHVDEEDVLTAARELQGLERMDQIKYAVLERSGSISIIPKPQEAGG